MKQEVEKCLQMHITSSLSLRPSLIRGMGSVSMVAALSVNHRQKAEPSGWVSATNSNESRGPSIPEGQHKHTARGDHLVGSQTNPAYSPFHSCPAVAESYTLSSARIFLQILSVNGRREHTKTCFCYHYLTCGVSVGFPVVPPIRELKKELVDRTTQNIRFTTS